MALPWRASFLMRLKNWLLHIGSGLLLTIPSSQTSLQSSLPFSPSVIYRQMDLSSFSFSRSPVSEHHLTCSFSTFQYQICSCWSPMEFPLLSLHSLATTGAMILYIVPYMGFAGGVCGVVSIMTMVFIGYDRYLNIMNKYKTPSFTSKQALFSLLFIWVYPTLIMLPPALGIWSRYALEGLILTCSFEYCE